MGTKEETELRIKALRDQLNGKESEYQFCIPGWLPETAAMGFRWMQGQLWEGFYVAHRIDHKAKIVQFKYWEFGEPEPEW